MNTIELNLLIADFMGGEIEYKTFGHGCPCVRFKEPLKVPHLDYEAKWDGDAFISMELHYCSPDGLLFHESWDWLMPVVEKIESVGGAVHIDADYIFLHYPNRKEKMVRHDYDKINTSKIQAVYAAVVQFIQWRNRLSPNR